MPNPLPFLLVRPGSGMNSTHRHTDGMTAETWRTDDPVARALRTVQMRSTFYCQCTLAEPWALAMPVVADSVSFHAVTAGRCWLQVPGSDPIELQGGDFALVAQGLGHELLSSPGAATPQRVDTLPQEYLTPQFSHLRHGGSGRSAHLICGVVTFDAPAAREVLATLPGSIVVTSSDADASVVRDLLRIMGEELAAPRPGGEAVATRLADILVVQAIRTWLARSTDAGGAWLRAMRDQHIGAALSAIHADPGRPWTLSQLARTATMSRSAFSARFTTLVGQSPVAYLTRWRMLVAKQQLSDGHITATQLASELGYQSDAAFNRAFKRVTGTTPGVFRAQAAHVTGSPQSIS